MDRASNQVDTAHAWTFLYTTVKLPSGEVVKFGTGSTYSLTYDDIQNAGGQTSTRIEARA